MPVLELDVATGSVLSVRRFVVREAISQPFEATIIARSADPSLDFDAIVGHPATFRVVTGTAGVQHRERRWAGICRFADQEQVEPDGLSTYRFKVVPGLWLLSQRRDYRIFQHRSAPDIATSILDAWKIERSLAIDGKAHPRLPFKVQYAESDYDFLCRILEEAGVAFTFPEVDDRHGILTLSDRLHAGVPRPQPLLFVDSPNEAAEQEFLTELRLADQSRPGGYTIRDHDLRRPGYRLLAEAERTPAPEATLEQFHYRPGAFLIETTVNEDTPVADDAGAARHDLAEGNRVASRRLESERADKRSVTYRTNVLDLWPGRVFSIREHPHPDLHAGRRLLVAELTIEGAPGEDWAIRGRAVSADVPYRPPLRTPRPQARVQSAMVVGGGEIDTDELGRVRVRFPWDRDGMSSCWLRMSHDWAGAGYGMMTLPRLGQEVLVDFVEGDPEQPVIVGRLFDAMNPVIEPLPERATRSAWKSDSGAGSFNEVLFEDEKGAELVYMQAERDARRLVKHDETSTIANDRRKLVEGSEIETTGANRVQETKGDRVELTYDDHTATVGGTRRDRVDGRALERIELDQLGWVGKDNHTITAGVRRELVEHDAHLRVGGSRPESVGGADSLTVGRGIQEQVGSYSIDASGPGGWIHLIAGSAMVIESAASVTLQGAGGFVTVDGGGVTLLGTEVVINEGGQEGSLPAPGTRLPERPQPAIVDEPAPPSSPGLPGDQRR